jgi:hypothetical protein
VSRAGASQLFRSSLKRKSSCVSVRLLRLVQTGTELEGERHFRFDELGIC